MSGLKQFRNGFHEGMKEFGLTINVLVTTILLLAVYIIGIGFTAIIAKIAGKHFLHGTSVKQQESYWSALDAGKRPPDDYYRQF